ncbi:hypothetical protein DFQ26_003796 [Actinomortierella ambigua]|nr:hypothetical protein DFQ26_003796 [Actinomortierella ambigua]
MADFKSFFRSSASTNTSEKKEEEELQPQPGTNAEATMGQEQPQDTLVPTDDEGQGKGQESDIEEKEPECPPEPVRWFHSVDQPLTKPNEIKKPGTKPAPRKAPTTWVAFNTRDSNALERAYQQLHHLIRSGAQPTSSSTGGLPLSPSLGATTVAPASVQHQLQGELDKEVDHHRKERERTVTANGVNTALYSGLVDPVLVNEDNLFEVDVATLEIKPVYWLGATYEVRRAAWFLQVDGKFVPCEANLSQQVEYGYQKHRPWIAHKAPAPALDANGKEIVTETPEKSWGLFGKYNSQYVVFTDAHHAWLLSDDLPSKVAKSIFTKVTMNANLGGARLIRGWDEAENQARKTEEPSESKRKDMNEFQRKREAAQQLKNKTKKLTEEEKDTIQESHEIDDYANETESGDRAINHLILVIHGVGQKLGDRMEAINFIHDVNVLRRTIKDTAATIAPTTTTTASAPPAPATAASASSTASTLNHSNGGKDVQDKEGTTKRRGSTASRNPYSPLAGSGVQVLPVEWRRQITFGMANEDEELQRDLSTPEAEEGKPTLDDIMPDGVPTIRMLVSDVLMDVLLYMTPTYKRSMMEIVTAELNRVYRLFIKHNPDFIARGGKVSILGHSLGSLLALDILNHQPYDEPLYQPIPMSPVYEKFISFDKPKENPVVLDFKVANFFALGSPIGLFLLLKGCKLGARLNEHSVTGESTLIPCMRPAVDNIYNVYHRSDPVAHRMEPLISRSFGSKARPALVPYHKGGLKGLHIGIQDFGNDVAKRANTMIESVKLGITTSVFTRALGFRTNPVQNAALIQAQRDGTHSGSTSDTEMGIMGGADSSDEGSATGSTVGGGGYSAAASGVSTTVTTTTTTTTTTTNGGSTVAAAAMAAAAAGGMVGSSSGGSGNGGGTIGTDTESPLGTPRLMKRSLFQGDATQLGKAKVKALNKTGRVDWCLQEGILESAYLSALSVHMQYWSDGDVAAFIIRQTNETD